TRSPRSPNIRYVPYVFEKRLPLPTTPLARATIRHRRTNVAKPGQKHFFIDPNRCIGCKSCVEACSECDTHKGHSMIHLETVNRAQSPQTAPVVCMHCDTPTCAEVCPADAIKR